LAESLDVPAFADSLITHRVLKAALTETVPLTVDPGYSGTIHDHTKACGDTGDIGG
jgi:hypothetical protein